LRIRHNAVFVSSILFTIVFLLMAPTIVEMTLLTSFRQEQYLGFASLAIILIGLVVTWSGFANRVRWTWAVMFVVVWVWFFPCVILPYFIYPRAGSWTWAETASEAWKGPGIARSAGEEFLVFSLMLIALILPIESFFGGGKKPERVERTGAP
jgi:hypothetical protein